MSFNQDKIIVVSGQPRSGTSLMMQTIEILGVPIWGYKYPLEEIKLKRFWWLSKAGREFKKELDKRIRHTRAMNPRGFYEINGLVMRGFRNLPDQYKGHAIKIIVDGLYERENKNGHLMGTPLKYIDKIILCLRDPRMTAVSQMDLYNGTDIVKVDEETGEEAWENLRKPISPKRYVSSMGQFIKWLSDHEELDDLIMPITYSDMHEQKPIEKIVKHLGIDTSESNVKRAIDNIDPLLKRSTTFSGWGENDMEGSLAEEIHVALKEWDRSKFNSLGARALEMIHNWHLESIKWVDTENGTWITVTPEVFRKGGLLPIQPIFIPMSEYGCKYFSVSNRTYTIERPLDLGDLERPMVQCNRDDNLVTIENCKNCWQRKSYRDGKTLKGQRHRNGEK
jgi:hemerythrin superfamily protein